jgi:hypothetical protein
MGLVKRETESSRSKDKFIKLENLKLKNAQDIFACYELVSERVSWPSPNWKAVTWGNKQRVGSESCLWDIGSKGPLQRNSGHGY